MHDKTAYKGEWLNYKRHGFGTQYTLSNDNTLIKIFEGQWRNDQKFGHGTLFHGVNELKVYILSDQLRVICSHIRNSTDILDCWTAKGGLNYRLYKPYEPNEHREKLDKSFVSNHWPCTVVYFKTGDIYIGRFSTKVRRNGTGVNFNTDGTIYTGKWTEDKKHGTGTLYPNFQSYQKDENKIKELIKQYAFEESNKLSKYRQLKIPILKSEIKDVLKIQHQSMCKMEENIDEIYKEEQQWDQGELVKSNKI